MQGTRKERRRCRGRYRWELEAVVKLAAGYGQGPMRTRWIAHTNRHSYHGATAAGGHDAVVKLLPETRTRVEADFERRTWPDARYFWPVAGIAVDSGQADYWERGWPTPQLDETVTSVGRRYRWLLRKDMVLWSGYFLQNR